MCLGRWGDPSVGEASKGHIKHGDFNRLQWETKINGNQLLMSAQSGLEGLQIEREVILDSTAAVMQVNETVHNVLPVGRLYNMMQHPTLSAPFLDDTTLINCNAASGFDYAFDTYDEKVFGSWPELRTKDGKNINLVNPQRAYSSVFPFLVKESDDWGWITAYSPTNNLLLGYVWKRTDYPWIAHWLHFENEKLTYRGLEFGTTGLHKPIQSIWEEGLLHLLQQPTCLYLDADKKEQRSYTCFQINVPNGFEGVEGVQLTNKAITIIEKGSKGKTDVFYQLPINHEI